VSEPRIYAGYSLTTEEGMRKLAKASNKDFTVVEHCLFRMAYSLQRPPQVALTVMWHNFALGRCLDDRELVHGGSY